MKKITLSFILLAITCISAVAQEKTKIEPSGNIIIKEIPVAAFDAINAKGLYELVLQQGDKESLKIEADDNLMDLFSVKNNGSTLEIDMLKLKDKNLDLSVIGNTRSEATVKADAFNLECKSVGNVDLKLNAGKLTVDNKGVGN